MSLCFIHLIEAAALILNAMGILNERRVLRPLGLDKPTSTSNIKNQLSLLFHTVRTYLRAFLIIINVVLILLEFVTG